MNKLWLFILTALHPVQKIIIHGQSYALNSEYRYTLPEVSKILLQSLRAPHIAESRGNALTIIAQFVRNLDLQPSFINEIYKKALLHYDPASTDEYGIRIERIENQTLYFTVGSFDLLLAIRAVIESVNQTENDYVFAIAEKSDKVHLLPKSYFCQILNDTNPGIPKPEPDPEVRPQTHAGSYSPRTESLNDLKQYFATKSTPNVEYANILLHQSDTKMQQITEIMMIIALYIVFCLLYIIGITLIINMICLISDMYLLVLELVL